MIRITSLSLLASAMAGAAFAADSSHSKGFFEGLLGTFSDATTNAAFLALVVFLFIAHRMGAFTTILGALDKRADAIKAELDEAKRMHDEAAKVLAEAERRENEAAELADQTIAQAKAAADEMIKNAEAELAQRLARREALAESRIARAEAQATDDVRRAAADAAVKAAAQILAQDDTVDQFDRAVSEIETSLR